MKPADPAGEGRHSFLACVRSDLERYASAEGRAVTASLTLRMIFLVPGFQFVLARRIQDLLYRVPVLGRPLGRIWWWWTCRSFGCELAIAARVGKGLYIPHPVGMVIGMCHIGDNVTILQNVTIGQAGLRVPGDPVIGDGAYLGAGAVILGDLEIGRGAVIGANSVVRRNVPAGARAVGAPARLLGTDGSRERPVPAAAPSGKDG
jgi:serine O-acetyltransferase